MPRARERERTERWRNIKCEGKGKGERVCGRKRDENKGMIERQGFMAMLKANSDKPNRRFKTKIDKLRLKCLYQSHSFPRF